MIEELPSAEPASALPTPNGLPDEPCAAGTARRTPDQYAHDLRQEVISSCLIDGEESLRPDKFTELVLDFLADAGEFDSAEVCFHQARGIQVNGYGISDDEESLDLFVSEYTGEAPPPRITRTAILTAFKRLRTFLERALSGYHQGLEEASHVYDMAMRIHELGANLRRVRLFLLTDAQAKGEQFEDTVAGDIQITHQVWDIERLYRCWSSGRGREAVEIDFEARFGQAIPCLTMVESNPDYTTYLAVLPGTILVDLYEEYGTRLLERNVRSFLQARGKVNAGIRQTIIQEPHMFLAYNNGISGTAEAIRIGRSATGGDGISWLKDFQIVNGGQTTASIYHAARKDRADVTAVGVQVKLTVIRDPSRMDDIVPLISEYANSQNKVQTADFWANAPYHRQIERFSRSVWAPALGGQQRQTHWYYERARGQYMDDREREGTPAKKKVFEATNPPGQKFSKTDLAKYENTWRLLPHLVSRGAQKNFSEFAAYLKEEPDLKPDQRYFERLVAKAILFRQAEKAVTSQKFGGYRANIVTYSLARLVQVTEGRIDLDRVWREQDITPALREAIIEMSVLAHKHIIKAPGNGNVTEWCKKENCWTTFQKVKVEVPEDLQAELVGVRTHKAGGALASAGTPLDPAIMDQVKALGADGWLRLYTWAKEQNRLTSSKRLIAYGLWTVLKKQLQPTRQQFLQGVKLLEDARWEGYDA